MHEILSDADFFAIDVETANERRASICQIGIAEYKQGGLVDEQYFFINPEEEFSEVNVGIHGIAASDVINAPLFPEVYPHIEKLSGKVCISHTNFDRIAIEKVSQKYGLPVTHIKWLDSAKVARRTWKDCAFKGYGLANLCHKIGFKFKHHDALEDAKASAEVLKAAIIESGISLKEWLKRVREPLDMGETPPAQKREKSIKLEGNPEGDLCGEQLVFTGQLSLPRADAAKIAAEAGCQVNPAVTKKTTLLVVGELARESSKYKKAAGLIAKGQDIKIITEDDFFELCKSS